MSILLIHGVGGRPRTWDMVRARLDPTLCQETVAIDVTVRAGQTLHGVAMDVMDRHPGSHILVGHSFGGMLAQEMALIDDARVHGLLLVSAIPGATSRVADINRSLADDIEARGIASVAAGFAAGLFAPGRLARSPQLGTAFIDDMIDAGAGSVCASLRAIADWDATDRLPSLQCPAVVITGACEPDLDRQALLAELVRGEFEVLDATGHLAPLEAPAGLARALTAMAGAVSAQQRRIDR